MDTLILKDGTTIKIEAGASIGKMQVMSESKEEMVNTWDLLTNENLAEVQIKNSDGLVVANYTNLLLVSETSTVYADGTILTSFNLRQKTEMELAMEELEEQTLQNEANIDYIAMETGVDL